MRSILIIACTILNSLCFGQIFVSTVPANKNVLIEEFTGVNCPNCPSGHQLVSDFLSLYPNRVFATHMHPFDSYYTTPLFDTDEDLSRIHAAAVDEASYVHGYPNGIISRRESDNWAFTFFMDYFNPIDSTIQKTLNEASPINIGLKAAYDDILNQLEVQVQTYATLNALGDFRLNVYLIQDKITTAAQWVSGVYDGPVIGYEHNHVFREVLTSTWGNPISSQLNIGDLTDETYHFDNTSFVDIYKMENMKVIAFITDHANSSSYDTGGEIVQVMQVDVETQAPNTALNDDAFENEMKLNIYNVGAENFIIQWSGQQNDDLLHVFDLQGRELDIFNLKDASGTMQINCKLSRGVYLFQSDKNLFKQKIVIF